MKLVRRQPQAAGPLASFPELSRMRREMERMLEDPFTILERGRTFFEGSMPKVDVYEDKDKITVQAELPGMRKEGIDVSLHGDMLTISGERKAEEEQNEGEMYRSERYYGRFQRSIPLPQPVDANRIQAQYKDGVLTITCPKTEAAKRKQIEVKTT
jgi:HSP20 family protein